MVSNNFLIRRILMKRKKLNKIYKLCSIKKQETMLLRSLLKASNIYTKQSYFSREINKNLHSSIIQHHINALITELLPLPKSYRNGLNLTRLGVEEVSKKLNKSDYASTPPLKINARVPNIKVNTDFSESLIFDRELDGKIKFERLKDIENYEGLYFDNKTFTLSGNTKEIGDKQFKLPGFLPLATGKLQLIDVTLKVTFIPDPKSLWKDLPSDNTARFHKPDIDDGYCENSTMFMMGSSVRGRSHAHKGIHRDDDFKLFCDNSSDWVISCVADGAGSCKYSRQGAYVAVEQATNSLKESLKGHYGKVLEEAYNNFSVENNEQNKKQLFAAYQQTMVKAVHSAAMAIQDCVDSKQGDIIKDFSTTLILAAHKKVDDGYLILSFWIGDGGIVIYDKNKSVSLLGEPDSGEFAGQTRFLDNKIFENSSVYNRVKMEKVDSMSALILATDGITDAWFETEKKLESLSDWDKLWEELEPHVMNENRDEGLKGLTAWMNFWSKGNHDDRTIAICLVKE